MSLRNELRSRIQYKIIVPFMALTLLVALAGSSVALLFVTGSAQERLNNQIAQSAPSVVLRVPEGVHVRAVDLATELQILAFHEHQRLLAGARGDEVG